MKTTGQNDQFDDIIEDPEMAEEEQTSAEADENDWSVPLDEEKDDLGDTQVKQLDDKEEKPDEEEPKKDEKEDESKDKDEKEETNEDKPDDGKSDQPKIEGKSLKLFKDGQRYEVPQDATVMVKVEGRNQKVTVQELRDNFSGHQAWDKKFTELSEKEKVTEQKLQTVTQRESVLNSKVSGLREKAMSALQNGSDPREAVNEIIDLLGVDSYTFNKVLFDSMSEEMQNIQEMDEYERKAYWLEKKTEHFEKKHESLEQSTREAQAREERVSKIDQLREAHGVSEEDFVSAYQQLNEAGRTNVSPEDVVRFAESIPHIQAAEELVSPYQDQLDDNEMEETLARVANVLKSQTLSREEVAEYLKETLEVEDTVNLLNNKAEKKGLSRKETSYSPDQDNTGYESFGDFGL